MITIGHTVAESVQFAKSKNLEFKLDPLIFSRFEFNEKFYHYFQTLSCTEQRTMICEELNGRRVTRFGDLSNKLLLMICRYLKSVDVLNAFLKIGSCYLMCTSDYYTRINLTNYFYTDIEWVNPPGPNHFFGKFFFHRLWYSG